MLRQFFLLHFFILTIISCSAQPKDVTGHYSQPIPAAIALNNEATAIYAQNPKSSESLEKAISLLDKAIATDADYRLAYGHKAEYLTRIGKIEQALETLSIYLKRNPTDPYTLLPMGILYEKIGNKEKAMDCYKQADANFKNLYNQDSHPGHEINRCLVVTLREGCEKGWAMYQSERNQLAKSSQELKANDEIVKTFTGVSHTEFIKGFWMR